MSHHAVRVDGLTAALHASGDAGRPLLLVHSVNAAASAAEVEPLRAHYSTTHQVFSLDLPGFGASDRPDRPYTPRLMTDAILQAARQIHGSSGLPLDALAVSLSCEFLARAAMEEPSLFRSIAMVSPTGFSGKRRLRAPTGETRGKPWIYALLRRPGWDAFLYQQLTRPGVIRYFLERTWGSKHIDEALWRSDIQMSQREGARFAPLYFLAAMLFSADVHTVYDALAMPVWVTHGQRGDFVDYRQLPSFAERGRWQVKVFQTGAMVYFEELIPFTNDYDRFLSSL